MSCKLATISHGLIITGRGIPGFPPIPQVTNPPIDPLREGLVMSMEMRLGGRGNLLAPSADTYRQVSATPTAPHQCLPTPHLQVLPPLSTNNAAPSVAVRGWGGGGCSSACCLGWPSVHGPTLFKSSVETQVLLKSPILLESELNAIAADTILGTKTFK